MKLGKIHKFKSLGIRSIIGGKDPKRLVEDFLSSLGLDADECAQESPGDSARWVISIESGEEIELLVEGMKTPNEVTIYMGVGVVLVPIRNTQEVLAVALEIADGLVGTKIGLVGNYLVLSATVAGVGASLEELEYYYKLLTNQRPWYRETLAKELGWDTLEMKQ